MASGMTVRCARSGIGTRTAWLAICAATSIGVTACGSDAEVSEFAPIPTRTAPTTTSAAPVTEPGGAIAVRDFRVLPTYTCLAKTPPEAIVTVGWTAPSATAVSLSLNGTKLVTGLQSRLPYEVPAGGAKGIGATVAFACDGADHTISVTWTADGLAPVTRTATITKERTDG